MERFTHAMHELMHLGLQQSNGNLITGPVDLLTMSECCINKNLTGVQTQVTGHRQCESMIP